jgi:hypothetical protein
MERTKQGKPSRISVKRIIHGRTKSGDHVTLITERHRGSLRIRTIGLEEIRHERAKPA